MLKYISIMDVIREATKPYMRTNIPPLRAGDVVRVHERIQEGERERVQIFEGLVIARKHGSGINATFTVRKIASRNVGVERIFPIHSPTIEKIEILRHEKVRRGKLYYVRNLIGKKTRHKKTTPIEEVFSFEPEVVADVTEEGADQTTEEPSESPEGNQVGPPNSEGVGGEKPESTEAEIKEKTKDEKKEEVDGKIETEEKKG